MKDRLRDLELDALREVGNIGSAHAATALSLFINKPVDMTCPSVHLVAFDQLIDFLGGPERLAVTLLVRAFGDIEGSMFFLMPLPSAHRLIRYFFPHDAEESDDFSEIELSFLSELGNILTSSYFASMADLTGLNMQVQSPLLSIDMVGAVVSEGLAQMGELGEWVLAIDTMMREKEGQERFHGIFCFVPEPKSISPLLAALGV